MQRCGACADTFVFLGFGRLPLPLLVVDRLSAGLRGVRFSDFQHWEGYRRAVGPAGAWPAILRRVPVVVMEAEKQPCRIHPNVHLSLVFPRAWSPFREDRRRLFPVAAPKSPGLPVREEFLHSLPKIAAAPCSICLISGGSQGFRAR